MKWSVPLGRAFGIPIGVHATFFLLLIWIGWIGWGRGGWYPALWAVAMVCILFSCVVLHELGHSLMARRFGISVRYIILLPIGGVAGMQEIPEEPYKEFLIAIAGPFVNVVIAGVLIPIFGLPAWTDVPLIPVTVPDMIDTIIRANILLIVFNMIPAFPMDGGRIFRSLLAMVISYQRATAVASVLGRVLAVGFIGIGFWLPHPIIILIGVFVFIGAQGEGRMVRTKGVLRDVPVDRVMTTNVQELAPHDPLRYCLEAYHHQRQEDFPVRTADGDLVGMLPRENWMKALREEGPDALVDEHMTRRFVALRPETLLGDIMSDLWAMQYSVYPVMQDDVVVGLLSIDDVQRYLNTQRAIRSSESHRNTAPNNQRPFHIDLG